MVDCIGLIERRVSRKVKKRTAGRKKSRKGKKEGRKAKTRKISIVRMPVGAYAYRCGLDCGYFPHLPFVCNPKLTEATTGIPTTLSPPQPPSHFTNARQSLQYESRFLIYRKKLIKRT